MTNRRRFFHAAARLPLIGGLITGRAGFAAAKPRDFFSELGVPPIINGAGAYTMMTGSLMLPEVVEAIAACSRRFVRLSELHDAVGKRIASLLGAEAAMVPSGAAAALTLGTAACITGDNPEFIQRIPDTAGMKNEVIVQKTHRFPYDHMVRNCGVRLIEVETAAELERAISPKTAHLLFLNKADPLGQVKMAEFVALGKKHRVPTFNDAAADVPPIDHVTGPLKLGFDLVAVSGGKGLRGPQSAGLLLGRADLIRAARLNTVPHSDTMGRSCKVNKEELVGMMVAVELYLKHDHAADRREWERRVKTISAAVADVPGIVIEPFVPKIANQTPHLRLKWDANRIRVSPAGLMQKLREGAPSIELVPEPPEGVEIAAWTLEPGEAEIVGKRIRAILAA
ncbi:MAG: PLP-dependent transferase [Bryobacteraceae bacterium]|nr:PLP-dependent transferase [Bryobacteraceae bacterium]